MAWQDDFKDDKAAGGLAPYGRVIALLVGVAGVTACSGDVPSDSGAVPGPQARARTPLAGEAQSAGLGQGRSGGALFLPLEALRHGAASALPLPPTLKELVEDAVTQVIAGHARVQEGPPRCGCDLFVLEPTDPAPLEPGGAFPITPVCDGSPVESYAALSALAASAGLALAMEADLFGGIVVSVVDYSAAPASVVSVGPSGEVDGMSPGSAMVGASIWRVEILRSGICLSAQDAFLTPFPVACPPERPVFDASYASCRVPSLVVQKTGSAALDGDVFSADLTTTSRLSCGQGCLRAQAALAPGETILLSEGTDAASSVAFTGWGGDCASLGQASGGGIAASNTDLFCTAAFECAPPTTWDGGQCTCTPTTCAASSSPCGQIPDGCGGTLDCGTPTGFFAGPLIGCFASRDAALNALCAFDNPDTTTIPGEAFFRDSCAFSSADPLSTDFIVNAHYVVLASGASFPFSYAGSLESCELQCPPPATTLSAPSMQRK